MLHPRKTLGAAAATEHSQSGKVSFVAGDTSWRPRARQRSIFIHSFQCISPTVRSLILKVSIFYHFKRNSAHFSINEGKVLP